MKKAFQISVTWLQNVFKYEIGNFEILKLFIWSSIENRFLRTICTGKPDLSIG